MSLNALSVLSTWRSGDMEVSESDLVPSATVGTKGQETKWSPTQCTERETEVWQGMRCPPRSVVELLIQVTATWFPTQAQPSACPELPGCRHQRKLPASPPRHPDGGIATGCSGSCGKLPLPPGFPPGSFRVADHQAQGCSAGQGPSTLSRGQGHL